MSKNTHTLIKNPGGPQLGTVDAPILEVDGLYFKDLARIGKLLPYEDWRLDDDARAKDLAGRLSIEDIAGLMLYSPHQMVPNMPGGPFQASYDGKPFPESGREKWALTDQQKQLLSRDHVRHVLVMHLESGEIAARWSNELQHLAESLPWGIPVNISSDPRHGASKANAEFKSGADDVSKWPESMGIAAAFSPELCREFAEAVSTEYRALGITTALSPQIDLGTEPRWMRFEDTFGPHPDMVTELGRQYCDGLQTTKGEADGWGKNSVCAMAKHWPGGGPCEGGRDAHYPFGKFAVYPGNHAKDHEKPFTKGALKLNGPTGCVSAIMPYYTVSWGLDKVNGKNVGNSYSHYLIHDLLRGKYQYDGIVCTDWGITQDPLPEIDSFSSRCYGVEDLTVAQRHLLAIENGVDQFGGNSEITPILHAYKLGCEKYGEAVMRERMELSAVRLLKNMFRCGLFENPYLNPEEADFALVFIESPLSDGYSSEDRRQGGNGYVPISLQYRPYKAVAARNESIAGGDFREDFKNRSYKGKIGTAANEADLDLVLDAKAAMGDKPVVVCLRMHNPTIVSELEGAADAILIDFGVQAQAILDIVSGVAEPSALLPVPMPANMETVEKHCEDSPFDIEPYVDTCGHAYDFAFGMNWSGVIDDERRKRYENA